jgi:MFS family permease
MTSPLTQDVSDLGPAPAEQPVAACAPIVKSAGRYRWKICALLFFATTLNYMDRQVLAVLKPGLQNPVRGIGLTEVQFAAIVSIFSAAYALGLLLAGTFVDKVGTRIGYAVAVMVWTLASMSHSLVAVPAVGSALHSAAVALASILRHVPGLGSVHWVGSMADLSGAVIGFGIVRFALGLGEAGNFPSAIKAVADGSLPRSVLWRRVSSTRGQTSGRHWLRLLSAFFYTRWAGSMRSWEQARSLSSGLCSGWPSTGALPGAVEYRPPSWPTSAAIPRSLLQRFRGRTF